MPGKLPIRLLQRAFFFDIGSGIRVILPPMVGEDAGVVDVSESEILAAHSDPITAAHTRIGWLSIHVAANDIASSGVKPLWFLATIILPESTEDERIIEIASDMRRALSEIGGSLIGGHTEYSDAVTRPLISITALGIGSRESITPTSAAMPGDLVIMTKRAAMEATSIAAYDLEKFLIERGFSRMELEEAKKLIEKISVVPEAIALSSEKLAHAMHDATEGGIAAAAFELSYASGWAVEIDRNQIPIFSLTEKILGALGADPLFSLSSGTLLAAVPKSRINDALSKLSSIGV
ncbi:MAG: AIR synthase family protein, partial [Fervidicoccaceae archaeon]